MMVVGILRIKLLLRGCHSLKEKRRILRSLKDQIRGKFGVSVAETDSQDSWQTAEIGVAVVGNESPFVYDVLSTISGFARLFRGAEVCDCRTEVIEPEPE